MCSSDRFLLELILDVITAGTGARRHDEVMITQCEF